MPVRSTMSDLIAFERLLVADPNPLPGTSVTQFTDQQVQDRLDANREDIRYEVLSIAPSIVNIGGLAQTAQTIYADFYSSYRYWEADIVLQGNTGTIPWSVLTPLSADYINGHWQFELNVYSSGTVPGQVPPVFATGKVYDPYAAAADLLQMWAATYTGSYDVSVDGQNLRRSQLMTQKLSLAAEYRKLSRPKVISMIRDDVYATTNVVATPLFGEKDIAK